MNAESVESNLGGGENGYLGKVLPPKQYSFIFDTTFVRLPDPGRITTITAWKLHWEEKRLLQEYKEDRRRYKEFRVVDAALKNHLVSIFN